MSNISKKFEQLKKEKKKALIAFIEAGDPSVSATEKLFHEIERSGADIIELGMPFSDSIADGPTIQEAANRAIASGTNAEKIFGLVSKIRKRSQIPVVLMTSYNIIFKFGLSKFINNAAKAKVDGLIVPDLPPEEAGDLLKLTKSKGVDVIFLVAPNSPESRIRSIADLSSGFIYLISLTGITGARAGIASGIKDSVAKIRKYTKKPIAVGFGISKPAQVQEISKIADGVIVGSAIVNVIKRSKGSAKKTGAFIKSLKKGLI